MNDTANDDEPKIPHKYLTTSSGAPLKFYAVLNEPCPLCGRGPNPNKIALLQRAGNGAQETVHCTSCDWFQVRRPVAQRLGPMNSGRRG